MWNHQLFRLESIDQKKQMGYTYDDMALDTSGLFYPGLRGKRSVENLLFCAMGEVRSASGAAALLRAG